MLEPRPFRLERLLRLWRRIALVDAWCGWKWVIAGRLRFGVRGLVPLLVARRVSLVLMVCHVLLHSLCYAPGVVLRHTRR